MVAGDEGFEDGESGEGEGDERALLGRRSVGVVLMIWLDGMYFGTQFLILIRGHLVESMARRCEVG